MAKNTNLLSSDALLGKNFKFVRSNGDAVSDDVAKKLDSLGNEIIEGEAHDKERNEYEGSFGNFFAEKLVGNLLEFVYLLNYK